MRTMIGIFLLSVVWTTDVRAQESTLVREVTSECNVYDAFDPELIYRVTVNRRDQIRYELNYWVHSKVFFLVVNSDGKTIFEKEIPKRIPETKLFEISEQDGNEATMTRMVQHFLKRRGSQKCP